LRELIGALQLLERQCPSAIVCFPTHPGSHVIETMPMRLRLTRAWHTADGRYSTLGPDCKDPVIVVDEAPELELVR
jgi:hypothetical protein